MGYLQDILLSGTLASGLLIGLIHSSNYWNAQFFGWEMGLNRSFHRTYNDHLGYNGAFYTWALVLTIVAFLLLRAFSRIKMLRMIAGAAALAVPSACLWFVECSRSSNLPCEGEAWLRLEGFAAVGCALLYAYTRWPISVPTTVAMLTLHSALWIHAYSVTFEVYGFCLLTPPIVAYFSTLMWGYSLKRDRQQHGALHQLPT